MPRDLLIFSIILAKNHPLVDKLMERLFRMQQSQDRKALYARNAHTASEAPHARLRQYTDQPAAIAFAAHREQSCLIILRIDKPQIIPAASRPLRHRIRFTASFHACFRINRIYPFRIRWQAVIRQYRMV